MQHQKIDDPIQYIKDRLIGQWEHVLAHFGLADQIARAAPNIQTPCPKTGEGKTKFRRFKDCHLNGGAYHNDEGPMMDGIYVIAWLNNWSLSETTKQLLRYINGNAIKRPSKKFIEQAQRARYELTEEERTKRQKWLRRAYTQSTPIEGTLVETYLRSRGIKGDLSSLTMLRFHPNLYYKDADMPKATYHPGMLALYSDADGNPITMHRTFIAKDGQGKANVTQQKKIFQALADIRGGAIRIDEPVADKNGDLVIGVCEGIENALSVREATGCPMWVGYSDRVMTMVKFDPRIKTVIIWADKEPSGAGKKAADDLTERLKGLGVRSIVMLPELKKEKRDCDREMAEYLAERLKAIRVRPKVILPEVEKEKLDWNDVYVKYGASAFPKIPEHMRGSFYLPSQEVTHDSGQ